MSFEELCVRSYGSAEYGAIAQRYHTLVLSGVQKMTIKTKAVARRFILLIDALYNAKVNGLCIVCAYAAISHTGAARCSEEDDHYDEGSGAEVYFSYLCLYHAMINANSIAMCVHVYMSPKRTQLC